MKDEPIEIAIFLLAQFYRGMFDATNKLEKIKTTNGPLWLLKLWTGIYFPSMFQYREFDWENKRTLSTYGEAMVAMFNKATVPHPEIITYLTSGEHVDLWHPCSARDRPEFKFEAIEEVLQNYAPQWLDDIRISSPEDNLDNWQSILGQQDLPWYGSKSAYVEVYNPNPVSVQFGLAEVFGFPFYEIGNRPWRGRTEIMSTKNLGDDPKRRVAAEMFITKREST